MGPWGGDEVMEGGGGIRSGIRALTETPDFKKKKKKRERETSESVLAIFAM